MKLALYVTALGRFVITVLAVLTAQWTDRDVAPCQAAVTIATGGVYVLVIQSVVQMEHVLKIIRPVVVRSVARGMGLAVKRNTAATQKVHVVETGVAPKKMENVARRRPPKKSCVVLRRKST